MLTDAGAPGKDGEGALRFLCARCFVPGSEEKTPGASLPRPCEACNTAVLPGQEYHFVLS